LYVSPPDAEPLLALDFSVSHSLPVAMMSSLHLQDRKF
jgi:hypothetical protein